MGVYLSINARNRLCHSVAGPRFLRFGMPPVGWYADSIALRSSYAAITFWVLPSKPHLKYSCILLLCELSFPTLINNDPSYIFLQAAVAEEAGTVVGVGVVAAVDRRR